MKVIVYISHDRHREDIVKVFPFSEENISKVEKMMANRWPDGSFDYFHDLPSENGKQYGLNEYYYDSYAVVKMEDEKNE
jgi:hypothetical protein